MKNLIAHTVFCLMSIFYDQNSFICHIWISIMWKTYKDWNMITYLKQKIFWRYKKCFSLLPNPWFTFIMLTIYSHPLNIVFDVKIHNRTNWYLIFTFFKLFKLGNVIIFNEKLVRNISFSSCFLVRCRHLMTYFIQKQIYQLLARWYRI